MPTDQSTKHEVREIFATVNGVDYCIEVLPPMKGEEAEYVHVNVKRGQPEHRWWLMEFSQWTEGPCSDLDAIRYSFRKTRSKMNSWLDSWRMHRDSAREEKGGKRGYYTRLSNEALKTALDYAAQWKLCKALWKQITKL